MRHSIVILLLLLASLVPLELSAKRQFTKTNLRSFDYHRLPQNLRPTHYDLEFDLVNKEDAEYRGQVSIEFEVLGPIVPMKVRLIKNLLNKLPKSLRRKTAIKTQLSKLDPKCEHDTARLPNQIILHADLRTLELETIKVKSDKKLQLKELKVIKRNYDHDRQMLALELDKKLKVGFKGTLEITFKTELSEPNLRGLFELQVGQYDRIVGAHLKPADARRLFPCFDEPSFKATFSLTLRHKFNELAVSNAPVNDRTKLDNGLFETKFHRTDLLAPGELSFVVGHLDYTELLFDRNPKLDPVLRVYSPTRLWRKSPPLVDYLLKRMDTALKYISKHLQMEFAWPKLDLIILPEIDRDILPSGLGIIQMRVPDDDLGSHNLEAKVRYDLELARAIASQWFGGLITADWWTSDLWITESLVAQNALKIVHHFNENNEKALEQLESILNAEMRDQTQGLLNTTSESLEGGNEVYKFYHKTTTSTRQTAYWADIIQTELGRYDWRIVQQVLIRSNLYGSIDRSDLMNAINSVTGLGINYLDNLVPAQSL